MTQLPAMKILDEPGNYFERVLKALFELGCRWITGGTAIKNTDAIALFVDSEGRITYMDTNGPHFMKDSRPAFRLASNGNLVPQRADDEGWMPHSGGECPVDGTTEVDVHLENGHTLYGHRAGDRTWDISAKPSPMLAITHYRIPSQVFTTSQTVSSCATSSSSQRKPVHQIEYGDHIFAEDLPSEDVINKVLDECERQGVGAVVTRKHIIKKVMSERKPLFLKGGLGGASAFTGPLEQLDQFSRITPTDLVIEVGGSPFEGKWVWSNGGGYNPGEHGDPQWVKVVGCGIKDSGQCLYTCEWDDGKRLSMFDHDIDWTAGVYDQKPDTEDDMSVRLTAVEALRGPIADGFCERDDYPFRRVETRAPGDTWQQVVSADDFSRCAQRGYEFRRKPSTIRIDGRVSEKTVETLRYWRGVQPSATEQARDLDAALDEILNTVES